MNRKFKPHHIIYYIILSVFSIIQIFPFYLKVVESLQSRDFIPLMGRIYLWPEKLTLENYYVAWTSAKLGRGFIISLVYVSIFTAISAVIAVIVGYVLAKKDFRGKNVVFFMLMSTMMVPGEVLFIPNYLLLRDLGLLNSITGLILPGAVNVLGIFLARQFMVTIPDSVIESAYIDGASELTVIRRIIFPLSGTVIATYVIITFTAMWNEYIWPRIILTDSSLFPVQLSLMVFEDQFATAYESILKSAGMVTTLLPVIIVFLIFQNRFVMSISMTGNK